MKRVSTRLSLAATVLLGLCFCGHVMAGKASRPLKVYILAGQSNMQGHAHVRTFDHIGMDPATAPMLAEMRNADGSPKVCDQVWISCIGCGPEEKTGKLTAGFGAEKRGPKIGPEFTFGIYAQKAVKQPILIIKTAWGGKSLNTDFRPPSAGPYEFNEQQIAGFKQQGKDIEKIKSDKAAATGKYYRLMMAHVKSVLGDIKRVYPDYDPGQGYELAGFVWFQGWNDMVDRSTYPNRDKPGGYDRYSEALAHFIRDVRKDLDAPAMPFVIGVMGAGGPVEHYSGAALRYKGIHAGFRKAMAAPAALPEFKDNVVAVWTEKCWDMQLEELRKRGAKVKVRENELKQDPGLSPAQIREAVEKFRQEVYTPKEQEILRVATSNFEFHYLGSGKIMALIGKAFAEALAPVEVK